MAKGTPLKERKAGENKFRDIDKTGNPKRKPLSPSAFYGYRAHAGPQHIPASEIGNNMADALFDQEMTRDLLGDNPRGAASSKRVAGKLKNVMASGGSKGRPHDEHDRDGGGSTFPPRSSADGPAARYGHTAGGKGDRLFDVMNDYGPDWVPTHDDANEYLDHEWPWVNETARDPASSKAVAGRLKNVMKSKAAGDASDPRAEGHPDIPYDYDEPNSLYDGFVGPIDPKMEGKNPPIDADHGKGHLPLDSKAVAGKLKNVATTKKAPAEKKRPPIPPYKPAGTSSKKIPARGKGKLPPTGLARYGGMIR